MGPEHQELTHAYSVALRASDLSQVWTQFSKKYILRLEPLHLATNANSIAGVAEPSRPTFYVLKSQVQFAIKPCPGQVDNVRNVSLKPWYVPMLRHVAKPRDAGRLVGREWLQTARGVCHCENATHLENPAAFKPPAARFWSKVMISFIPRLRQFARWHKALAHQREMWGGKTTQAEALPSAF